MFKTITLILCLAIAGCTSQATTTEHYTNRETISHPAWPTPLQERSFQNHAFVEDGELYIGKTYEDDLEFQMYMEDIYKYIQDLTSDLCFYRTDLKEQRCQDETPQDPEPVVTPTPTVIKSPTAPSQ